MPTGVYPRRGSRGRLDTDGPVRRPVRQTEDPARMRLLAVELALADARRALERARLRAAPTPHAVAIIRFEAQLLELGNQVLQEVGAR